MFENKSIFITGGTGTIGKLLVNYFLAQKTNRIIIYSRDEYKQSLMKEKYTDKRMRYFLGDVRDLDRMTLAMRKAEYVIHAAALKQIDSCTYNPMEAIKTNTDGTTNVIRACIKNDIQKAVIISTDKVVNASTFYGKTKAMAEDLWIYANVYEKIFNVVRLGNINGSRGSVLEKYIRLLKSGVTRLPITNTMCTRFNMVREDLYSIIDMAFGNDIGYVYIPIMDSYRVMDLITELSGEFYSIGLREREKTHELLISDEETNRAIQYDNHFIIYPDWAVGVDKFDLANVAKEYISSELMIMDREGVYKMIQAGREIYDNT